MFTKITLGFVALALTVITTSAQPPAPIVVQAVVPAATIPATPAAVAPAPSSDAALKALSALKAANEEVLLKQAATLLQLEEMEKAADQIKIYSKRG